MPLYEYSCVRCGDTFEVIQRFSDAPLETCQKCGGPVKKLLSSPAIQFKGAGWYINDYSRKGNAPADGGSPKTDKDKGADSGVAASAKETGDAQSKSSDSSAKKEAASKESVPPKASVGS